MVPVYDKPIKIPVSVPEPVFVPRDDSIPDTEPEDFLKPYVPPKKEEESCDSDDDVEKKPIVYYYNYHSHKYYMPEWVDGHTTGYYYELDRHKYIS